MANILVVDDDASIRKLVRHFIEEAGYTAEEASDGVVALRKLESFKADLVILDVMMPNMDGWRLCSELRGFYPDMPLLMLTAKGETSQKVKGFELGTDDYVVKPFVAEELIARVRALLKRYRIAASATVQIGHVTLNRKTFETSLGDDSLSLPPKEFELLFKLASYPGQTLLREQLIEAIWGLDFDGNERTLDVHVNRIRERFPETAAGFRIATVRGLGYRMEPTKPGGTE